MRAGVAWVALALALFGDPGFALGPDDLKMIAQAAERGSASSQVLLATAYLNGDGGLARSTDKAAYWFEQAAILGNAYAEEKLADIYEQGLGVPANQKLAFDWRVKAANRGMINAQVKVGIIYQEGVGVGRDTDQAIYWFHRAAAEGNAEAQYRLGRIYHFGNDVEVDRAMARSWFEMAARQGYEKAVMLLDLIESIGYQIDEVWHKRLPELRKLADDGDLEAGYQLVQRYEHGIGGVRKDTAVALDWYRRAASGGHPMAMRTLAQIYAQGMYGVTKDADVAAGWTAKANAATH